MKALLILIVSCIPTLSWAQKLPNGFTCQDLLDIDSGKLSRTVDGGNTYVPIRRPQFKDPFGKAMLAFDTSLCHRLSRGEITVDQFDAMHAEKAHQLGGQRAGFLTDQKRLQLQQKAVQNQGAAIRSQAIQSELSRRQREAHHQDNLEQGRIQQDQLEQIRQGVSQPKTLTCFGSGNFIHCN
jgi:hypothetical protein